jgi:hypothetical protein
MSTAHFKIPLHKMLYSVSGMKKTVKRTEKWQMVDTAYKFTKT